MMLWSFCTHLPIFSHIVLKKFLWECSFSHRWIFFQRAFHTKQNSPPHLWFAFHGFSYRSSTMVRKYSISPIIDIICSWHPTIDIVMATRSRITWSRWSYLLSQWHIVRRSTVASLYVTMPTSFTSLHLIT